MLVRTTIIETGLDISNANTLIVDRVDNYGLSQLRGRVGRGRERAYAYFLYPAEKPLGEVVLERLKAVASHNELGAGMQLALKDLEIRGGGNLWAASSPATSRVSGSICPSGWSARPWQNTAAKPKRRLPR